MNVKLTGDDDRFVKWAVSSGRFRSPRDVLGRALDLLRLQELRKDLDEAEREIDEGKGAPLDIERIKREGRARLARRKKRA